MTIPFHHPLATSIPAPGFVLQLVFRSCTSWNMTWSFACWHCLDIVLAYVVYLCAPWHLTERFCTHLSVRRTHQCNYQQFASLKEEQSDYISSFRKIPAEIPLALLPHNAEHRSYPRSRDFFRHSHTRRVRSVPLRSSERQELPRATPVGWLRKQDTVELKIVTSATLLVTGALLVVTKKLFEQ